MAAAWDRQRECLLHHLNADLANSSSSNGSCETSGSAAATAHADATAAAEHAMQDLLVRRAHFTCYTVFPVRSGVKQV